MAEALIGLLIQICIIALVVYLIFWVLGAVGIPVPAVVIKIIWIIVALYVILLLLRGLPGLGLHLRL